MITIIKNANFSEWFDIRLFGKLIDNTKTEAQALNIASRKNKELSLQGERALIGREGEIIPCEKYPNKSNSPLNKAHLKKSATPRQTGKPFGFMVTP